MLKAFFRALGVIYVVESTPRFDVYVNRNWNAVEIGAERNVASTSDCGNICLNRRGCTAYTWFDRNTIPPNTCSLQTVKLSETDLDVRAGAHAGLRNNAEFPSCTGRRTYPGMAVNHSLASPTFYGRPVREIDCTPEAQKDEYCTFRPTDKGYVVFGECWCFNTYFVPAFSESLLVPAESDTYTVARCSIPACSADGFRRYFGFSVNVPDFAEGARDCKTLRDNYGEAYYNHYTFRPGDRIGSCRTFLTVLDAGKLVPQEDSVTVERCQPLVEPPCQQRLGNNTFMSYTGWAYQTGGVDSYISAGGIRESECADLRRSTADFYAYYSSTRYCEIFGLPFSLDSLISRDNAVTVIPCDP